MIAVNRSLRTDAKHQRLEAAGRLEKTLPEADRPGVPSATDVEQAVSRAIRLRTSGQVRLQQVQILGANVVLRGWADSYHAVQLALAGLLEAFRDMNLDRPEEVELDIDVVLCKRVSDAATRPTRPR